MAFAFVAAAVVVEIVADAQSDCSRWNIGIVHYVNHQRWSDVYWMLR